MNFSSNEKNKSSTYIENPEHKAPKFSKRKWNIIYNTQIQVQTQTQNEKKKKKKRITSKA